jgi:hypothetical protein
MQQLINLVFAPLACQLGQQKIDRPLVHKAYLFYCQAADELLMVETIILHDQHMFTIKTIFYLVNILWFIGIGRLIAVSSLLHFIFILSVMSNSLAPANTSAHASRPPK